MKIIVLGGAGVVGSFLTKLLTDSGHEIIAVDKNRKEVDVGFKVLTIDALELDSKRPDLLQWADVVIFALPEQVAVTSLQRASCQINKRKVTIINTCSIQQEIQDLARVTCPDSVSVGINPMFSPKLSHINRTALVCEASPTRTGDDISEFLVEAGMRVTRLTPSEHDRTMSACQTLPHTLIITYIMSMPSSKEELATLLEIAPPPMQALMCLAARIIENEPETYWDIQKNNGYSIQVRDQIKKNLNNLESWLEGNEVERFHDAIRDRRESLGDLILSYGNTCRVIFEALNSDES